MNPRNITISYHFTADRKSRLDQINFTLNNNWGVTLLRVWDAEHDGWKHLTTTGLVVCMSKDESCIATMFIPSISQFYNLYRIANVEVPPYMKRQAHRNYDKAKEWEEKTFKKVA